MTTPLQCKQHTSTKKKLSSVSNPHSAFRNSPSQKNACPTLADSHFVCWAGQRRSTTCSLVKKTHSSDVVRVCCRLATQQQHPFCRAAAGRFPPFTTITSLPIVGLCRAYFLHSLGERRLLAPTPPTHDSVLILQCKGSMRFCQRWPYDVLHCFSKRPSLRCTLATTLPQTRFAQL